MSTSARELSGLSARLRQKKSRVAASQPATAVLPNLKMYRSESGFNAIMSWYEDTEAKIPVPVESVFVETRFGRTHMLAASCTVTTATTALRKGMSLRNRDSVMVPSQARCA